MVKTRSKRERCGTSSTSTSTSTTSPGSQSLGTSNCQVPSDNECDAGPSRLAVPTTSSPGKSTAPQTVSRGSQTQGTTTVKLSDLRRNLIAIGSVSRHGVGSSRLLSRKDLGLKARKKRPNSAESGELRQWDDPMLLLADPLAPSPRGAQVAKSRLATGLLRRTKCDTNTLRLSRPENSHGKQLERSKATKRRKHQRLLEFSARKVGEPSNKRLRRDLSEENSDSDSWIESEDEMVMLDLHDSTDEEIVEDDFDEECLDEETDYEDDSPPGDRVAYIHVGEGGEADLEAQLKGAENLDIQILEEENLPDIDESDMIHGLDHTGTARDYVDERHRCTVNCPVGCQGHLRPNEIVIYESYKWQGKLRGRRR